MPNPTRACKLWIAITCAPALPILSSGIASALPTYSIQQVGLTGNGYSYNTTSGTFQGSYVWSLNSNPDEVVGSTFRYASNSSSLGQDSWLFNRSMTQQIGLTGAVYSFSTSGGTYESSTIYGMNNADLVSGTSYRVTSSGSSMGQDTWLFNGFSTQHIGFTGSGYSYVTGSGTYQFSTVVAGISNAGLVAGASARYSSSGVSLGEDAWLANGSSIQQIGLTGSGYSYSTSGGTFQESNVYAIDTAGQALGYSNRYSSTGSELGSNSWLYNGSSTQQIGLTGSGYNYSTTGAFMRRATPP